MLQLFVDDSGKADDSAVCVLAGYLSTAERWAAFSDEWADALRLPPAIDYFKMKEAMRLKDEFLGFDADQRDNRLRTLARIIARHAMAGFISIIPSEPFVRIMRGWGDREYLNRPYFMLFHNIIVNCVRYADQSGLSGKIDFIFDQQGDEPKAMGDFQAQFHEFASVAPESAKAFLGSPPIFRDEKVEAVPLQAADLLAWYQRRVHHNTGEQLNPIVESLIRSIPHYREIYTEQALQDAANKVIVGRFSVVPDNPILLPQRFRIFDGEG